MSYTYDGLSRVTKRTLLDLATEQSTEEQFTYDAAGNITGSGDTLCNYDINNRLTAFAGNSLTYDAEGNLLKINGALSDTPTDFAYDSSNRLICAGDLAYTYNAEDTRIRAINGDTESLYTYDTTARLSKLLTKAENGVITKYVYGMGLIGEETANAFTTYHFDYRGSTVAVTDSTGFVLDTYQYDTYGKLIDGGNSFKTPFLYNGRDGVMTEPNGLCYMRARYYSPVLRRFINADIVAGSLSDAITLNRYAYANGNPVSNIDPFGLSAERGNYGPTALEAAYMAKHIYTIFKEEQSKLIGDWEYLNYYSNREGLLIGIYIKEINGVICYAIVNAGSETDLKKDFWGVYNDWVKNNFTQPFGASNDIKDSIQFAEDFVYENPNAHVTFVGHSKGGAEAIANAVATNKNAIVFNPATVNLGAYSLSTKKYNGNVTSYVVDGEILDFLSVVLGKNIGTEITLKSPYDYERSLPEWDSQLLGAQDPMAQLGQFLGSEFSDFIYASIEKHDIDLVIELLGGKN